MKQKSYNKRAIQRELKKLNVPWTLTPKATQLTFTFTFPNYLEAFMFVARVSVHAEVLHHHPELTLSYGKVRVKLTTHDVTGLTKKDLDLAKRIEVIYAKFLARGKQRVHEK